MGLHDYGVVALSFNDKNEAPVWSQSLTCSNGGSGYIACLSVKENSVADTLLGLVAAAVDPDILDSQTLTYEFTSTNNLAGSAFMFVVGSSDRKVTVKTAGYLDFEQQGEYQLTIIAKDSGFPQLSTTRQVLVLLEDVNEAPVVNKDQVRNIDENSGRGTTIGLGLTARDQDSTAHPAGWGTLTYEL